MQSCLPQLTCVQSELMIGRLTHTPQLYYVPILDINNREIKVPCLSLDITIEQLLEEYKANSAGIYLLKEAPCLVVSQGELSGSMALPTDTVISYGFNFNEICFRVRDPGSEDLDEMLNLSLKSKLQEKDEQIKVKILFQNNLYQMSIKSSFTLLAFKKTMIREIPSLKSKSPDLLQVQHRGFFIIDDKALLSKYQIASNSVILVILRKINGCFSRRALVMLADHREVTIDQIKQGDKVLSYNHKTGQLEIDTVSYLQKNVIKEALEVEFQDGRIIETTPNHKFLCDDGEYRCFTKEDEKASLKEGSTLALYQKGSSRIESNGSSRIKSIFNRPISPLDQQFFHLSIEVNHNFIVNGLIAHNMFLKIKFQTNLIEQINATPQDLIKTIKNRIEEKYHIQVHYQKLLYFGKELNNYMTIADYNIPKESTLHFQLKNVEGNLVREGTPILMADGNTIEVQKIKRGNKIAVLNNLHGKVTMAGDVVNTVEKVLTNDFMVLNLGSFDRTDELIVSSDSYLQSQNGEVFCVRDLCYELDEDVRPRIKRVGSNPVSLKGVSHYQSKQMQVFYKISTNSHNFIAKSVIMFDFVANMLFLKQSQRVQKVVLGSDPSETMGSIKQKLKTIQKIDPNVLFKVDIDQALFIFDDNKLANDDSLRKYEIDSSKIIEAIVGQSSPSILKSSDILMSLTTSINNEDKDIYLQVSASQKYMIKYFQYRNRTVGEIIREVLPHFDSSCFFIFSDTLISPSDYLLKLQQSPEFQKTNEIQLLMVKNQKLAFLHHINIKKEGIKNHCVFLKEENKVNLQNFVSSFSKEFISRSKEFLEMKSVWTATKRIEGDQSILQDNFKLEIFYNPFLYLTSRKYNQQINSSIRNFTEFKEEFSSSQAVFTIIKDIYLNMQLLPHYYDKCHLGVNNFRFSRYFKEKDTFYLYGFTMTFKQSEQIKQNLYHQSGSLLIIRSLNGRQISQFSLYPQEKEVLFAPFTCFFVEKIVHQEEYDEVYLVEISSPISFQKDIILWVDDEPKNNIRDIKKIYKEVNIQILQVTSTSAALRWIEEFGWLLNWKGLEFKIISDMGRWENSNNEFVLNKRAGIDLLIELYNNYGVTARTLIYCGDEKKAQQMAKNAQIPKDRYDITANSAKLIEFCRKKLR